MTPLADKSSLLPGKMALYPDNTGKLTPCFIAGRDDKTNMVWINYRLSCGDIVRGAHVSIDDIYVPLEHFMDTFCEECAAPTTTCVKLANCVFPLCTKCHQEKAYDFELRFIEEESLPPVKPPLSFFWRMMFVIACAGWALYILFNLLP